MMWWNGNQWYVGLVMMVLFLSVVIALVAYAVRRGTGDRPHRSAREQLDDRFARGELSEDEYNRKRAALEGRTPHPHS